MLNSECWCCGPQAAIPIACATMFGTVRLIIDLATLASTVGWTAPFYLSEIRTLTAEQTVAPHPCSNVTVSGSQLT